jgi:hypothetical protein
MYYTSILVETREWKKCQREGGGGGGYGESCSWVTLPHSPHTINHTHNKNKPFKTHVHKGRNQCPVRPSTFLWTLWRWKHFYQYFQNVSSTFLTVFRIFCERFQIVLSTFPDRFVNVVLTFCERFFNVIRMVL